MHVSPLTENRQGPVELRPEFLPCRTALAIALSLVLANQALAQGLGQGSRYREAIPAQATGPASVDNDNASAPGNPGTHDVNMFVGETRVFSVPGARRIAVGNGKVMSASAVDGREILAFANAVGTTSMLVWTDGGDIRRFKVSVAANDTQRLGRDIARFLANMPGIKTHIIGESVIVEGEQLSDRDLAKIDELSKRYPQIMNFTNRQGWESMILIDVKVVEFPKTELRELGLKWSAAGGVAVGGVWSMARRGNQSGLALNIPTTNSEVPISNSAGKTLPVPLPSGLNVLSAMNMGINAELNMMAQDGRASILSEPQLSARNGSKATFLAGGEFPFTVSTLAGQTVVFKPYGIRLDIVPRVDRNGNVRASIESEVSSIDTSTSTSAGPALLTRKTNTEFNMRTGETLVLSGLLSRRTSNSLDKVPGIGDVPVLGALFRSRRFQNDETELVVFVTPTVVSPSTPELVNRVNRATAELQAVTPERTFLPAIRTAPQSPQPPQPPLASQPVDQPALPPMGQQAVPVSSLPVPAASTMRPASVTAATAYEATGARTLPLAPPPVSSATPAPGLLAAGLHRVMRPGVAVRAEPKLGARILGGVDQFALVNVLPRTARGDFVAINWQGGSGWVTARWLSPLGSPVSAP